MTNHESDEIQEALRELGRQRRLINQSLTMHAALRDRNQLIGTLISCTVLTALVVGVAFAFAGSGSSVTLMGLKAARATWLGWLAVVTAVLTLVELVLDRRGVGVRHATAVRMLAGLKTSYRIRPAPGSEIAEAARLSERYAQAMDTLPPIPERYFNRLKSAHLRKVEVSKLLSKNPGMSYWRAKRFVAKTHRKANERLPTAGSSEE